ncbi:MAG: hypothetical protein ACRD3C_17850 [Vicinamibacterales bacterium]
MTRFILGLAAGLLVSGILVHAQGRGQKATDSSRVTGSVHVTFSTGDVQVIRHYYAPRYRRLPPGLQKKLARTGQLPPGWQKKFEPFPADVERRLVALPAGYRRGVFDGRAVIFNDRTHVLLDVAVLF